MTAFSDKHRNEPETREVAPDATKIEVTITFRQGWGGNGNILQTLAAIGKLSGLGVAEVELTDVVMEKQFDATQLSDQELELLEPNPDCDGVRRDEPEVIVERLSFDEPEEFGREDRERELGIYQDEVQWHDFDDFPHEDYDFYEELPDDVEQELANFEANPFARDE